MKPSRVSAVLKDLLQATWPVFLWGPPGVGKSSIVRAIAQEKKLDLLDVRASLLDPTDLRGIPIVNDGKAVWCPPSFLPSDPNSCGVLFFDELNAAPPLVQASLYQLTLDRRVGEYRLPDGWRIIAAGNRAQDASIVFRMPAALSNRFIHLDFEVDVEDWHTWAVSHDIHPLVTGFISLRRNLLFDMKNTDRAFPTPRSWEMLSTSIKQLGSPQKASDVLIGIVGEGAAMEFLGYCKNAINEKLILEIIQNPKDTPLPTTPGDLYALISYLATQAADGSVRRAAGILLDRLNPEFAVLLARDIIRVHPKFALDKGFMAFAAKHKESLK